MRSLIIDDSRTMRLILSKMLRDLGMEVIEAGNGVEALKQLQQHPGIGLLLVDWNMPEMNGYEFVCAVRSQRAYDAIPILMVTSEAQVAHVTQALQAGANEYLMKPFDKELLTAKLQILGALTE